MNDDGGSKKAEAWRLAVRCGGLGQSIKKVTLGNRDSVGRGSLECL